jgi:hypothetical protein
LTDAPCSYRTFQVYDIPCRDHTGAAINKVGLKHVRGAGPAILRHKSNPSVGGKNQTIGGVTNTYVVPRISIIILPFALQPVSRIVAHGNAGK